MRDLLVPRPLTLATEAAFAVLLDRLGGSAVVSQEDRDAVAARFGGAVGVRVERVEAGRSYRFSLAPATPDRPLD